MEERETKPRTSYGDPPWRFKGSAVYQLHLVKSDIARALAPKQFRLVEAFGYTLGGFFLANYDDSPAGVFDELVVIAGIVWNPPTSCAWASKVLVNSKEACLHGRKEVGLPSHVARFTKRMAANTVHREGRQNSFLNLIGFNSAVSTSRFRAETDVTQTRDADTAVDDIFSISLLNGVPADKSKKAWLGPAIKMSLPSFSGQTEHNPSLMKYSCQMECRVRVTQPLQISSASPIFKKDTTAEQFARDQSSSFVQEREEESEKRDRLSLSVMLSKPILALEFNCLDMKVEAPLIVSQ